MLKSRKKPFYAEIFRYTSIYVMGTLFILFLPVVKNEAESIVFIVIGSNKVEEAVEEALKFEPNCIDEDRVTFVVFLIIPDLVVVESTGNVNFVE